MSRIDLPPKFQPFQKFVTPRLIECLSLMLLAGWFSWCLSGMAPPQLIDRMNTDTWFDADIDRVYENITVRTRDHQAAYKHPLFSITFWSIAQTINTIVDSLYLTVRIILALNAAVSIALLLSLLTKFQIQSIDRILFALLYIASGGFVFWYSMIETFPFGATSILIALHAVYWAKISSPVLRLGMMVFSGLASISVTITNFAATIFTVFALHGLFDSRSVSGVIQSLKQTRKPLLFYFSIVLFSATSIGLVQDLTFGDAGFFLNLKSISQEVRFVGLETAVPLWARPGQLFICPIVIPSIDFNEAGVYFSPETMVMSARITGLKLDSTLSFIGSISWSLLLVVGVYRIFQPLIEPHSTLTQASMKSAELNFDDGVKVRTAAFLTLLTFFGLHLFYGAMPFLYVSHMLPLLTVVASAPFVSVGHLNPLVRNGLRGVLLMTIVLIGPNNFMAFRETVMILSRELIFH